MAAGRSLAAGVPVAPVDNVLRRSVREWADSLGNEWQTVLRSDTAQAGLTRVDTYVEQRRAAGHVIYPEDPFRALRDLSPDAVRVVILGQDPYHGPGQAQGLAFSVPDAAKRPPSLRNIFKELAREFDDATEQGNDLTFWAEQGVLLLNTSLTVEDGAAGAHARQGWEAVTDALIRRVAASSTPTVFMLWGAHAQAKAALIPDSALHYVLMANHPSPLSATRPPAPFIGCGHFAMANEWLNRNGQPPISWLRPITGLARQGELGL